MLAALPWLPGHFQVAVGAENQSFAADPLVGIVFGECSGLLGWDVKAGTADRIVDFDFGRG